MKLKRFLITGFAAMAMLGVTSCNDPETPVDPVDPQGPQQAALPTDDLEIFGAELGTFDTVYAASKTKATDSERYVAMAEAEAELLKAAVFLPTTTQGGNYAITRVAPRTAPYALWGTDEYRYKNLVVTNELIKAEDRTALLNKWTAEKGKGDEYNPQDYAKTYLEGKGYTLSDKYIYQYTEGTETFDWLATSMASDSEVLVNLVDGLVEYDGENQLVPALAEALPTKTVNADGNAVYTFKIKQGLYWADAVTGAKTDYKVTANDFVTGFQHMLDAAGGLEYLVQGVIKNANEYLTGEVTDFAEVGVKAVDEYTLTYEVIGDPSYFLTYLSYNIYQPLNKEYFLSKGGALGRDAYADAVEKKTCTYGTTRDTVLTCGAYYISEYADQSTIVYTANPNYWDAANILIKEVKWMYNDGKDQLKGYNWAIDGTISGAGLNTAAIAEAKKDSTFDTYAYTADTTATTYFAAYNLNRQTFELANGGVKSNQTAEQAKYTKAALLNQNFRLALSHAFDKGNWNAQSVGDELKYNALRNTYTPYGFVSLPEDVTVEIGGASKTFKAGTQYGEVLQAYCDAKGLKIDVKDGVDGWYNVTEAKAKMALAVEELAADGYVINADNKVNIDIFYYSASTVQTNQANSYKASIEAALGDYVVVNLIPASTQDDYYVSGYRAANGAAANYDVFYGSGWGPDYGDPSTYLDTFLAEGAGYMTKTIGLW